MEKPNYSPKQNEKPKKFKKTKSVVDDPCLICGGELYLDSEFTQRVGLLNDLDEVTGWMCPHCKSEFDTDGKITSIKGQGNVTGEA